MRLSRRTRLLGVALALLTGGCGEGPRFEPVRGRVIVAGKPLTAGSVSFRPDVARGNTSQHHPTGAIDADGNFELYTAGKKGAPPGWYKVLVFADANASSGRAVHPSPPKWLTSAKYTDVATTDLAVEVVVNPEPDRYDLKLDR